MGVSLDVRDSSLRGAARSEVFPMYPARNLIDATGLGPRRQPTLIEHLEDRILFNSPGAQSIAAELMSGEFVAGGERYQVAAEGAAGAAKLFARCLPPGR
jgi:hypothetical protein